MNYFCYKSVWLAAALLLGVEAAWSQATRPADLAGPARIATRYSLTSTTQPDVHDPTAWRFLASNDGGSNWIVLDVKTNQQFVGRSQRVTYYIPNRHPYSTFRLQIDAKSSTEVGLDMSVQLAGFDITGPLVNVPDERKLHSIVSASCAHPVIGPAEFAFDDDPTTQWCDYGLGSPEGCWLQIHYALDSEVLVTNLSQASILTHVAAARARLADGGGRVLSNLAAQAVSPRRLAGYALTSANDEPGRDPRDWELLGSNDDGKTWSRLDRRVNEVFTDRFERRLFTLTNAAAFRLYRLQIDQCMATNGDCQVAEITPVYADPQTLAKCTLVVEANADNPPLESAEMAFDLDSRSKWLSFFPAATDAPCWVQWQLTPKEEDLPVVNQRQLAILAHRLAVNQLLEQTNSVKRRLTGYALTSANDFKGRDPADWKLLGSNDGGKSWDVLDSRKGQEFATRLERRLFSLPSPVDYEIFRFQIEAVESPTNANSVQLAELELEFADSQEANSLTILASSQGENAPAETVSQLFDGDAKTKWLDYAASSSNHTSWIEWRYVNGASHGVLDMNRTQAASSWLPDILQMRLPVTVLFTNQTDGMAGVGDSTGFQWVHLEPWPARMKVGASLVLNGELNIRGGTLFVSKARTDSVPASSLALDGKGLFASGNVTGRITGVFSGSAYCGATLSLSNGATFIARFPGASFPIPPNVSCPVKLDGIIEKMFSARGHLVPAVIWTARPDDIVLSPETDEEWNELPAYSPMVSLPAAIWLRGQLTRSDTTGIFSIRVGTNLVELATTRTVAASPGSAVKAAGILSNESGRLILRHACVQESAGAPAVGPNVLTRIFQVRQFMGRSTNGSAAVKIRGVVTYVDLDMGEFYVQAGDEGLQITGQMNAGLCPKLSDEGNEVELEGVAQPGVVYATQFVRVLGKGRLPEPARVPWDHLMAGTLDDRWVEVEGVIAAAEQQRLTIDVAGGQLIAWINELQDRTARSLAGSVVRVRGVCSPVVNARNQRLGVRLLVPNSECIDLLSVAPELPFELPLLSMGAVMGVDLTTAQPQRYVHTQGVLSCKQGRLLFLQDQNDGMRVTLRDDFDAVPGDIVEVVGMPRADGFSPKLIQAVIRKTGHGPVPKPVFIDLPKVNLGDLAQQQDASQVQIEGILVNDSVDATRRTLNLRNEEASQVFCAYLPLENAPGSRAAWPVGSRLKIQGVFKAIQNKTPDVDQTATSFELYVNSSRDIAVLERPSWWTARHTLQLMGVFAGILALGTSWIWLLRKRVRQRTHDLALKVEELKRSELSLAAEVAERKRLQADADRAHNQLLAVARQAGMAEVATGILHNVGNVLNSVNVSSTLVIDRLRQSRVDGLDKAVALLRKNEAELGAFFKTDERGKNLLPYLEQLSTHLSACQRGTMQEMENLGKNVQHIKDIVAVQQDYAKFAGITERLPVTDLVEDALRMTAASLERHKIQVVRLFDPRTPPVETDRHKVLQILVNVIRNAQQACDETGHHDKRIVLAVQSTGKFVSISVTDNGIGIAPENLGKIFNHGFTTRKDGHGFGLHNAALAAQEMGGALRASSDGPGNGASFTLELPLPA